MMLMSKLNIDDLIHMQWINHTGQMFDNLILAWFVANDGKNYELIFDEDECPLVFGLKKEVVNKMEGFYRKEFKPVLFNGMMVYCHEF